LHYALQISTDDDLGGVAGPAELLIGRELFLGQLTRRRVVDRVGAERDGVRGGEGIGRGVVDPARLVRRLLALPGEDAEDGTRGVAERDAVLRAPRPGDGR